MLFTVWIITLPYTQGTRVMCFDSRDRRTAELGLSGLHAGARADDRVLRLKWTPPLDLFKMASVQVISRSPQREPC
jgi:hypothetical protein